MAPEAQPHQPSGSPEITDTARRALRSIAESARLGEPTPQLLALCDPDIEVDASRRVFNPHVYNGRDGIRRLVAEMWEVWDGFFQEDEEFVVAGNRVLAVHTIGGRGRASGAEARSSSGLVFTIEDGRVVRVVAHTDPDEARRSLEQPEQAMLRRNVTAVLELIDAQQRGDDLTDAFDPDVEWDISAHPLPDFPDRGAGREAILAHLRGYFGGWKDYAAEVRETIGAGDEVVSILHERASLRGSSTKIERDLPIVWTLRAGRCVRFRVFRDREEALAAAGLEA